MRKVSKPRQPRPFNPQRRGRHPGAAIVYCLSAIASTARAHPGHSLLDGTAAHIVTSPYHLAALAGGGLLLVGAGWSIKRQTPRRFVQYVGVVAMAAAVLLWGLRS